MAYCDESRAKTKNLCKQAINEITDYHVLGIYGSPLESEWQPSAAYILLKEMYRFEVMHKEFKQKSNPWRFEFLETSGGRTMVFVFNEDIKFDFCDGPNAFYVKKK